jgi:ubiquinone/menaquinone biosynthesis C-methylase UbiE
MIEVFNEIKLRCENEFPKEELWPYYFKKRYLEFISFYEKFKNFNLDNTLEIGCGLGYYSIMLSKISKNLTATDIEFQSEKDHAIGLQKTIDFVKCFNCNNISIKPASVESLPFMDNTFDFVFSSHVLEHVPDKVKAVKEIYRVLKPGGIFFCITPSRSDRFYAVINNYIYLIKRSFYHLYMQIIKGNRSTSIDKLEQSSFQKLKNAKRNFPFPDVHGASPSFSFEFKNWSFAKWRQLLLNNAPFYFIESSSTELNPLANMTYYVSPWFSIKLLKVFRKIDVFFGKISIIRTLGVNCIVVVKK